MLAYNRLKLPSTAVAVLAVSIVVVLALWTSDGRLDQEGLLIGNYNRYAHLHILDRLRFHINY